MIKIKELINGVEVTETTATETEVRHLSHQSRPFIRTTNEADEVTFQIIDAIGEIYNMPAVATDFRITDLDGNEFAPTNGAELIEYSGRIRAFRASSEADKVHVGEISTETNSVTIALADDGVNWAKIDGKSYEKHQPDLFNFAPVATGQKILIIHALPDAQVFHLAQGTESTEAVEPAYSGLFVARILVTPDGGHVEDDAYKLRAEDAWRSITLTAEQTAINVWTSIAGSYELSVAENIVTPTITGLTPTTPTPTDKVWPGRSYDFYNKSTKNITFHSDVVPGGYVLKPGKLAQLKERFGKWDVISGGDGMPGGGIAGDILAKTADGTQWSSRLTSAETKIDTKLNREQARAVVTRRNKGILLTERGIIYERYLLIYNDILLPASTRLQLGAAYNDWEASRQNLWVLMHVDDVLDQTEAAIDSAYIAYASKSATLERRLVEAELMIEKERVNAVRVGGRNLILKSDFTKVSNGLGVFGTNGGGFTASTSGIHMALIGAGQGIFTGMENLKSGKEYVLSVWTKATFQMQTSMLMGFNSGEIKTVNIGTSGSEYVKTSVVIKTNHTNDAIIFYSAGAGENSFYLKYIKLEEGVIATDWTPAPEDKLDVPAAPGNTAEFIVNGNGSASPKSDFIRTTQVEVGANTTALESWKGKLILVTSSCTLTIPGALSPAWACDVATLAGVTLTLAIAAPKSWLFGTPPQIGEKSVLTIAQRGNTNSIAVFGL